VKRRKHQEAMDTDANDASDDDIMIFYIPAMIITPVARLFSGGAKCGANYQADFAWDFSQSKILFLTGLPLPPPLLIVQMLRDM
jgi:hypothetical protein